MDFKVSKGADCLKPENTETTVALVFVLFACRLVLTKPEVYDNTLAGLQPL